MSGKSQPLLSPPTSDNCSQGQTTSQSQVPCDSCPVLAPEKLTSRGCSKWAPLGRCSRQLDAVLVRRRPSEGQGLLRARQRVRTTVSLTRGSASTGKTAERAPV